MRLGSHGTEPAEHVAGREGGEVVIPLSDDGKGIDTDAVRRKAVERGLIAPDAQLSEQEIIGHCVKNLAKFKVPQQVAFIDALPRNATGKVLKRELRVKYIGADKPAIS